MYLNKQQTEAIIQDGQKRGLTGRAVIDSLVRNGYEIEGIQPVRQEALQKETFKERFAKPGERIVEGIERKGEKVGEAIRGEGEFADRSVLGRATGATATAFSAISNTAYLALPDDARKFLDDVAGGVGKGVEYLTDKIAENPRLQKYVMENDTAKLEEALKITADLGIISGEALLVQAAATGLNKLNTLEKTIRANMGGQVQKEVLAHLKTAKDAVADFGDKAKPEVLAQLTENTKQNIVRQFAAEGLDDVANQINAINTVGMSLDDLSGAINQTLTQPTVLQRLTQTTLRPIAEKTRKVGVATRELASDLVPSRQRIINEQVTRALDLTTGDLDKIARATGNELGVYMADKNLIGANKASTMTNVKNLADSSYKSVREEIGKVDKVYKPSVVPNYKTALDAVQKELKGVVGQEKSLAEVNALLKKKTVSLSDVQRAKELLDEHFSLYKVTGEVKDATKKQGLANVRSEIRQFIEKEVKETTGADIKSLNNDVATSNTILQSVKTRSPKGLTSSNLKLGDLGVFGAGTFYGGPITGVALVVLKKIAESPSIRLRVARFLDKIEDSKRNAIIKDLEKGKMPKEIVDVVNP